MIYIIVDYSNSWIKFDFSEPFDAASWIIVLTVAVQISAFSVFLFEWLSPAGFDMKVRGLKIYIFDLKHLDEIDFTLTLHIKVEFKTYIKYNTHISIWVSVYIFEELCKKVNIYVQGTRYSGNEIERRDRLTNSCGLYQVKL